MGGARVLGNSYSLSGPILLYFNNCDDQLSDHLRFSLGTASGLSGSNPDHSPGRVPGVSWVSGSVDRDGIPPRQPWGLSPERPTPL